MEAKMSKEEFFYGKQQADHQPDAGSIRDSWETQLSNDGLENDEAAFLIGYEREADRRLTGGT